VFISYFHSKNHQDDTIQYDDYRGNGADLFLTNNYQQRSIPVAARFQTWVWAVRFLGFQVLNSPGAWMSLSCVLSGRDFCNWPITHPEQCHRLWCVGVWPRNLYNQETLVH